MLRNIFEEDHRIFREGFRKFVEQEIVPYNAEWEEAGVVSREVWLKAGDQGYLAMDVPEEYGGLGIKDFRFNNIVNEELMRVGATGVAFPVHTDVIVPYITHQGTEEQKHKYLPKTVSGETITAIAMTEPGMGSDLAAAKTKAVAKGDGYVLNGQKTFITNGVLCDLVIVFARTNSEENHGAFSLLLVDRDMEGYKTPRMMDKIGMRAQDTAELFFEDVFVPRENLLGEEGRGFYQIMDELPQERLSISVAAMASVEAAFELTVEYCHERLVFGKPLGSLQNSKFKLAEMKTEIEIGRLFVDQCTLLHNEGKLGAEHSSMAKWWTTDLQKRVTDQCLQLHGGYGYMKEYPISKFFVDGRITSIFGGANEIMKEIIGRSMGF